MFEFTSTLPSVIDYGSITKVQSTIRNLQDLTRSLNVLCGTNPVSEMEDSVVVSRSYVNSNGAPLVMRGSKAIKIGGKKEDFTNFPVDPFIMTDSYTQTQLNLKKALFKNNEQEFALNTIRNKFIAMAMLKGYITLNGFAIKCTNGGEVTVPMIDGNGQMTTHNVNFGKVHGSGSTDYTSASFTVANITSSSKISEFMKNISAATVAMVKNGVSLQGARYFLGDTLYWLVVGLIDSAVASNAIPKTVTIGDKGDDFFTLNGRKYELSTDTYTDPNTSAVTKFVEDKEFKIIGNPSYHLWTYLKPDEPEANGPVLYYAKDWYENNPAGRTMLFNMRHYIVPDTNAIARAQIIA